MLKKAGLLFAILFTSIFAMGVIEFGDAPSSTKLLAVIALFAAAVFLSRKIIKGKN